VARTDSTERAVPDLASLRRAGRIARTGRIACVDLPAFPLQLLLRRHPDWRGQPTAVVAEDNPQALLLWVSESARRAGILPGMRYASALALDRELRAAPVDARRIAAATEALHRHLLTHSPRVEPARHEPGVFWLDAGGLERVGGTPTEWAERLWRGLREARFVCGVTVGFSRFGTYCLSRVHRQAAVINAPAREAAACRRVSLARLDLPPRVRDDLARLGLSTVADLLELPRTGLAARFGPETAHLVELAGGLRFDPLQPVMPAEPVRATEVLDAAESDAWRLLFLVKRLLHPLLDRLAKTEHAVALLHLDLHLDLHPGVRDCRAAQRRESLRPAEPTLDVVLLTELVRLRLEGLDLSAGVEQVAVELITTPAPPLALELFRRRQRRDLAAALRAVARVRAELGDQAVVRAELQPGHLPEQAYCWRQLEGLTPPAPTRPSATDEAPPLVRRLLPHPRPLLNGPPDLARTGSKRLLQAAVGPGGASPAAGTTRVCGPHLVSGGWWAGEERRAYHFVEADGGRLLWVYYDEQQRRWYLQGTVE
jgi:protein ImuB